MNCPRCQAKMGEEDIYCPQCGLNLMDWYMKDGFGLSLDENQESSVQESREFSESDNTYSKPEGKKEYQKQDVSEDSSGGPDKNNDDLYGNPYQNMYNDPYGGFGNGFYDDPYKNIRTEEETDISSEISDDPYKNILGEEQGKKEPDKKEPDQKTKEKERAVQEKQSTETDNLKGKGSITEEKEIEKQHKDPVPPTPQKKKSKGGMFVLVVLLAVGVGVGYWMGQEKADNAPQIAKTADNNGQASDTPTAEPQEKQQEIVTPTEAIPDPTATPTPEPELMWQGEVSRVEQESVMVKGTWLDRNHMTSLMDASGARYGLYVMDLTNHTYYDIGEAETPLPASALIGIPIMYTIAEGVSTNAFSMTDPVLFTYTFANGRGNIKANQNGQYFALGDMLKEALLYSDNNALNSLIDFLTLDRINSICHEYGFDSVDMQRKLMTEQSSLENYISPKDAAMMLNAIYQNNFTEIDRSFLMNYYMLVPGDSANKGMYPACGKCDVFLNLNGITETRYNEVGLVVNGEEVFIMAAMTVDGKQETSAPCVTNEAQYVLENLKVGER